MPESPEQMHERLCGAIAAARFEALSQPYAWQQVSQSLQLPTNALAAVRDGSAWYALAPIPPDATGAYRILVFHYRRIERFGFRGVACGTHEERGGHWCYGGVRLRRPRDTCAVANFTRPVRLLGMSMGPGR
jgi:hypothetical protein